MLKKIFVLFIKFMPVIEMAGMLINNTLYYKDEYFGSAIAEWLFGDAIIHNILLFVSSYLFGFCIWHRLIITSNIINITIATYDRINKIPIEDLELLLLYYIISSIFILISTYTHIKRKDKNYEYKT